MTDKQWQIIIDLIAGKSVSPLPVGFIVDSPWLPGWAGEKILDYFSNDECWFQTNMKAVQKFPEVIFFPGFWSELGMCTEPSAFGAKCIFHRNELPFVEKMIYQISDIDRLTSPNPETDGLGPFVLNRLLINRKRIESLGHKIRFAVTRGPLTIASFLMGTTEFLISLRTHPDHTHKLLEIITDYLVHWLRIQKRSFDTIDGVFILDDIIGFCGEPDFKEFAVPYLQRLFNCIDVQAKFLHNDADGRICASYLSSLGINLFNFSFLHSIEEMKLWTNNNVVLVGNVPPRDVLARGTDKQIYTYVHQAISSLPDRCRVIMSCGGGMPDGVHSKKLRTFMNSVWMSSSEPFIDN